MDDVRRALRTRYALGVLSLRAWSGSSPEADLGQDRCPRLGQWGAGYSCADKLGLMHGAPAKGTVAFHRGVKQAALLWLAAWRSCTPFP